MKGNVEPSSKLPAGAGDPRFDPDARRKKIQALKVLFIYTLFT